MEALEGAGGALLARPGCVVKDVFVASAKPQQLQVSPQTRRNLFNRSPYVKDRINPHFSCSG